MYKFEEMAYFHECHLEECQIDLAGYLFSDGVSVQDYEGAVKFVKWLEKETAININVKRGRKGISYQDARVK